MAELTRPLRSDRALRALLGLMASDCLWAETDQAKGFRLVAHGIDVILMHAALAGGIKVLRAGAGGVPLRV